MPSILSVKGTRDFYPEEMAFQRWLYHRLRTVSEQFGYQEFDGPFLERLDLYAAKSGEELVKEQSFVFPDRGGEMIALRPELTPSLARMVAARSAKLSRPIRWWSYGPFWRYERPQKGRSREFFQWNIDLLGVDTPQADAEIASIAACFFREVGLSPKQIRIVVNNRRLMDSKLVTLEIDPALRSKVFRLIDRKEKMEPKAWADYAEEIGLSTAQFSSLKALLDNKEAWRDSDELIAFFESINMMGTSDYFEYDPTVIRGLDYYTGTVFEARDSSGKERAILGGGRYDDLVADVGGDPLPGVGFAMGDVVLGIVLENFGAYPSLPTNPAQVFIPIFDKDCLVESLQLATELRSLGLRVEWYPEIARLQKQFKYADRQRIPLAVILGPDEIRGNVASVKDLRTGEQSTVNREQLADSIQALLNTDELPVNDSRV
jgi:histidyl-tRNA synthetase